MASASIKIHLSDEQATAMLMADLGLLLSAGDIVTLSGNLGAGKTSAARALIRYLAGDEHLEVPSPTFTLVQRYDLSPLTVLHADLYRLNGADDLDELDLLPPPEGALVLIEWPERAGGRLPADRVDIALSQGGADASSRTALVTGHGRGATVVARLVHLRVFLDRAGLSRVPREKMAGDASSRSYARLRHQPASLILMNSPPRPDGPPVRDGRSYSALVHLAENVRPFVAIANGLRAQGFSAPEILHADLDQGFLVTEDFGGVGIVEDDPPRPIAERFHTAMDVLAKLHATQLPKSLPLLDGRDYPIPDFDLDAMMIEVDLMPEWYLPDRGVSVSDAMRSEFETLWLEMLQRAANSPKTWVLRDFHSPNVIWLPQREDIRRVGIIDFQDTVLGPEAYDVVSLAQDARLDISEAFEIELIAHYVTTRRRQNAGFSPSNFAALYALMSAQRNTRLLGTFARLNRRDHKPQYLRHQPRVWDYLQRALAHPSLAELRRWYATHLPAPAGP